MNEDYVCLIVNWLRVKSRRTRLTKRTIECSNACSVFGFIKSAHIVGEGVELSWVESLVSTGGISDHGSEVFNISLGKFVGLSGGSWVGSKVVSHGGFEFTFADLSIVVGVDDLEDSVRLFH